MKCKWQNYLYLSLFALLGLLCGSSIINAKNNVSAFTWTSPNLSSYFSGNSFSLQLSSLSDSFPLESISYATFHIKTVNQNTSSSFHPYFAYSWSSSADVNSSNYFSLVSAENHSNYFSNGYTVSSCFSLSFSFNSSDYLVFGGLPVSFLSEVYVTLSDECPSSGGIIPSGSLSITENGEYDVSSYATAVVEVPDTETIIQGDYHEDLIKIYNGIMACAGTALVIYFFYCIYRIIIKNTGAK